MKKVIYFLFLILLSSLAFANEGGIYGKGVYGKGVYGISDNANSYLKTTLNITPNTEISINNSNNNTVIILLGNTNASGYVTIINYNIAPSGVGSSPATSLNNYIDINTNLTFNYSIIKIIYTELSGIDENTIRLYRWNGSSWNIFDGAGIGWIDTVNNLVYANTTAFSTWGVFGTSVVSTPTSSSGGGSSGGGGGSVVIPKNEISIDGKTMQVSLKENGKYKINFKKEQHILTLDKLYYNKVDISLTSRMQKTSLNINEEKIINIGTVKFSIKLSKIVSGYATFSIKDLTNYAFVSKTEFKNITDVKEKGTIYMKPDVFEEPKSAEIKPEIKEIKSTLKKDIFTVFFIFLIILGLLIMINQHYKKRKEKNEETKNDNKNIK